MLFRSTTLSIISFEKYLLVFLFSFFGQILLFPQTTIRGEVVDGETGELLIGAVILQKGTKNGTITDVDGTFKMTLLNDSNLILQVGYTMCYEQQEIIIGDTLFCNVEMVPINCECEVVILPNFAAHSNGAIKKITPNKQQGAVTYASQLIQNQVAGMNVSRPGDDPNEDFLMRLRGISSFQMRNTPLVVVDGLPQSSLYLIDPNDIASIKVLKDAASAAKYGILGHAGVVEIKTQQVADNFSGMSFDYRSYLSSNFLGREIPIADKKHFLAAGGNDLGHETDWIDEITKNTFSHGHHLNFKKRHKYVGYNASLGYRSNRGVLKKSGFEQMNGRIAFNAQPDEDLQILGQIAFTKRDINYSSKDAFREAIIMNPTAPVKLFDQAFEETGYYYHLPESWDSPMAMIDNRNNLERVLDKTAYLKTTFDLDANGVQQLFGNLNFTDRENIKATEIKMESRASARRNKGNINTSLLNLDIGHAYSNELGKVRISQKTGFGFYQVQQKDFYQYGSDIFKNGPLSFSNINADLSNYALDVNDRSVRQTGHRVYTIFSDTYFKNRYWEVNTHLRHNGLTYFNDEEFNDDVNYKLFYGTTFGIRLHEIGFPFFQYFTEAKLRFGYGKTGGAYERRPDRPFGFNLLSEQFHQTNWRPINMEEDNIIQSRWEEKKEINIGFDFVLSNERIYGSIDLYQNQLNDLMVNHLWWLQHYGEISNSGMEVDLHFIPIQNNNFSWKSNILFSTNKSVVGRFSLTKNLTFDHDYIWLENGEAAGQIFAFEEAEELQNGALTERDLNGDGRIITQDDAIIVGSGLPTVNLSWQNSFSFKRLRVHLQFRSLLGHRITNVYRALYEQNNASNGNFVMTKYFREDITNQSDFISPSYFEKGDFLKLDFINIGYDLPFEKMKCHIYLSGQNLLTWTGYTGLDPEARYFFDGSTLRPGVEFDNGHFRSKTVTVGIQMGFK